MIMGGFLIYEEAIATMKKSSKPLNNLIENYICIWVILVSINHYNLLDNIIIILEWDLY